MTTRLDIMEQIKTDILDNMKSVNGYNQDIVECRIGVFDPEDFEQLPSIGIWMVNDEVMSDTLDTSIIRQDQMIAYIYCNSDGLGDFKKLYEITNDLEKFLYNTDHFTYANTTKLGRVSMTYSGIDDERGLSMIFFTTIYEQTGFTS